MFGKDSKNINTTYYKKKKELKIVGLNASMVDFLKLVGNKTIKNSNARSVTIDVKAVKDVEQALSMIEIVNKVV